MPISFKKLKKLPSYFLPKKKILKLMEDHGKKFSVILFKILNNIVMSY